MPPYSAFDDMPDLSGKVFLVTGANRGCGLECTRAFLRKGAEVVMACRNESNALAAISLLARDQSLPRGATDKAHYMHLDLGDLESVRKFSEQFLSSFDRLDCLLNNAGLLVDFSDKTKAWTVDGFERTIGVNYLGPFALTALLFPLLERTPKSRVVNVSSILHFGTFGMFDPTDLSFQEPGRNYDTTLSYACSKLAALLFTRELSRRIEASSSRGNVMAVACHPGVTNTRSEGSAGPAKSRVYQWIAMDSATGALSLIFACVDPSVKAGSYIGPDGWFGIAGMPGKAHSSLRSKNRDLQRRLFEETEKLVGVPFAVGRTSSSASGSRRSARDGRKSSSRASATSGRTSAQRKSTSSRSSTRQAKTSGAAEVSRRKTTSSSSSGDRSSTRRSSMKNSRSSTRRTSKPSIVG